MAGDAEYLGAQNSGHKREIMGVELRLRLHRFWNVPFLHHLSLEAKSKDGRETVVMEHFPTMDPTNVDPNIISLVGLSMKSDPVPSFEVSFEAHPEHTVESIARFSRARPRHYWLFFNDCRTHSFAVIKHAMHPPWHQPNRVRARGLWNSHGRDLWKLVCRKDY